MGILDELFTETVEIDGMLIDASPREDGEDGNTPPTPKARELSRDKLAAIAAKNPELAERIGAAAGEPPEPEIQKSLSAKKNNRFDPNQPRGDDGRWIDTGAMRAAVDDEYELARLMRRISKVEERAKFVRYMQDLGMTQETFGYALEMVEGANYPPHENDELEAMAQLVADDRYFGDEPNDWASENGDLVWDLQRRAGEIRLKSAGLTVKEATRIWAKDSLNLSRMGGASTGQDQWMSQTMAFMYPEDGRTRLAIAQAELLIDAKLDGFNDSQIEEVSGWLKSLRSSVPEVDALHAELASLRLERQTALQKWARESEVSEVADRLDSLGDHDKATQWILQSELKDHFANAPEERENRDPEEFARQAKSVADKNRQLLRDWARSTGDGVEVSIEHKITADTEARKAAKLAVIERLGNKLQGDPELSESLQALAMEAIPSHRYSLRMEKHNGNPAAVAASAVIDSWAETSGDSNHQSVAFQIAAARELGLPESEVLGGSSVAAHDAADDFLGRHEPALRGIARAIYDDTQRDLREAGINEVVLYRGSSIDDQPKGAGREVEAAYELIKATKGEPNAGTRFVVDREVESNPLSSWTIDPETGYSFSTGWDNDRFTTLSVARVPREHIFSTFRTGPGCMTEAEFLVIGHPREAKQIVTTGAHLLPKNESGIFDAIQGSTR